MRIAKDHYEWDYYLVWSVACIWLMPIYIDMSFIHDHSILMSDSWFHSDWLGIDVYFLMLIFIASSHQLDLGGWLWFIACVDHSPALIVSTFSRGFQWLQRDWYFSCLVIITLYYSCILFYAWHYRLLACGIKCYVICKRDCCFGQAY